jgi:hypothetical protein
MCAGASQSDPSGSPEASLRGLRALRRTIEIPRWSKPNRTDSPESLREGNGSCTHLGMAVRVIALCPRTTGLGRHLLLNVPGLELIASLVPEQTAGSGPVPIRRPNPELAS